MFLKAFVVFLEVCVSVSSNSSTQASVLFVTCETIFYKENPQLWRFDIWFLILVLEK